MARVAYVKYLYVYSNWYDGLIGWKLLFSNDPNLQDGDGAWCPTLVEEVRLWRV